MKKVFLLALLLPHFVYAQKWVDTTYQIQIDRDLSYGTAVDFAGNTETLTLDVAFPTNDTPPLCGRPLILVIYGGAWMSGDKGVAEVQRLMQDFVKRGYVAVAPNYRLGLFQTEKDKNCNLPNNLEWKCLNAQDTMEWYRAYYRAVQDIKGAIRYMVNNQTSYDINPNNIFTSGFSAGGFNALGAAFLDDTVEWPTRIAGDLSDALPPHTRYDNGCIKKYDWDTSILSLNLQRKSLGTLEGNLNYPTSTVYKIKGVGNLFGGMFINLLQHGSATHVGIYTFHQPNDLIVPYRSGLQVFHGFNACAYGVCNQGIINRPFVYSSPTIRDWAVQAGIDVHFDSTTNNTDCAGQIADPSKGGHQLDNWNRTWNMAAYFATKIDTSDCSTVGISELSTAKLAVYPNPTQNTIAVSCDQEILRLVISDMSGKQVYATTTQVKSLLVDTRVFARGMYLLSVYTDQNIYTKRIVLEL